MAAGLDLVARKSLESGSEASVLINGSFNSFSQENDSGDLWSWRKLREEFCLKKMDSLFAKYQSRLHHSLYMTALMVNVLSGTIAIFLIWTLSTGPVKDIKQVLAIRCVTTASSLMLYVLAYQERWFLSQTVRLLVAVFTLFITASSGLATSVDRVIHGEAALQRFSSYPLFVATVFLPFPKWYQVGIASVIVIIIELTVAGYSYSAAGELTWQQLGTDLFYNIAIGLLGLYIKFLIEFTNRKAFLDRRKCFENKFHLQSEKEQEEHLLLSVLPKHISQKVRKGIREAIKRQDQEPLPQRPFTELFVERYSNVSILYADIVNSVALTASLNVSELVETLNELFGSFDESAEKNYCTRIKLLGDCYYCVSGILKEDLMHADHCVQMGLDMIEIIRCFREESRINVDMRIGVHSGSVLSGLLGLRKWQFDIWSKDVDIASRMEQTGRPGCVHISRATKDLLKGKYNIESGKDYSPDANLDKYNMETFFIIPSKKNQTKRDSLYIPLSPERPASNHIHRSSNNKLQKRQSPVSTEVLTSRRRTVISFTVSQFQQMLSQVNELMEKAIDGMALSKKDQWFHSEGIHPLLLTFQNRIVEKPFLTQWDPLFKYSLLGALLTTCVITAMSAFTKPRLSYFWVACAMTFIINISSIIVFWIPLFWTKFKKTRVSFIRIFEQATGSFAVRMAVFAVLTILQTVLAVTGMEGCTADNIDRIIIGFHNESSVQFNDISCKYPWYFTCCVILSMTSISMFIRVHFFLKFLFSGGLVAVFFVTVSLRKDLFRNSLLQDWSHMPAGLDQCWCVAVTWFLLHFLDRQVEYIGRLDYLWKQKLIQEQKEAQTMGTVNKTLLMNILPAHVAKYYLDKESMHRELEYHEEYTSVAVMFASIPNYMDFYSESLVNEEGRQCLQVLHEIICDFDKLLYESAFLKLEKIKTIGSTYMVAAGLQPGRNSSRTSSESSSSKEDKVHNVLLLLRFAFTMMDSLHDLNRNSWQDFKLRIGIAVGPVVAGVVGASKPQYDIWGDTVNIASRMDSTGIVGSIQVTESVAEVLKDHSKYECHCRGETFVKGKGLMTTYLVHIPEITKL